MKLPRRVPWSTQKELLELHAMLWDDFDDEVARRRGLSRLSVYLSSPTCPAFMHLLQSLLAASLTTLPSNPDAIALTNVRLTYAMAIVRFINGMVDPMQTGTFARSITQIAQQLGIPVELVQMRHQATHEDLPSLGVLQAGLRNCLYYLRDYAMGPLVHGSAGTAANLEASTSRQARLLDMDNKLDLLLKRYKRLMKAYYASRTSKAARSTDQAWSGGAELRRIMRELEDLWSSRDEDAVAEEDAREVLVNKLVQVGFLVPLSRKKRPSHRTTSRDAIPGPTLEQRRLWTPLLQLADSRLYDDEDAAPVDSSLDSEEATPSLTHDLAMRIVVRIQSLSRTGEQASTASTEQAPADPAELDADFLMLPEATDDADGASGDKAEATKERKSYILSLTSWLVHFLSASEDDGGLDESQRTSIRKTVLLAKSDDFDAAAEGANLDVLYSAFAAADPVFAEALPGLNMQIPDTPLSDDVIMDEAGLEEMESRMASLPQILESLRRPEPSQYSPMPGSRAAHDAPALEKTFVSAPGWHRISMAKWTPKPMGIWQDVM